MVANIKKAYNSVPKNSIQQVMINTAFGRVDTLIVWRNGCFKTKCK